MSWYVDFKRIIFYHNPYHIYVFEEYTEVLRWHEINLCEFQNYFLIISNILSVDHCNGLNKMSFFE